MGKPKKRATKRTPKQFTSAEVQQNVAGAVARWQGMARGIPDPPGTEVIEVTFEDAPPVSEAERQSGIRLHKRLVDLERLSHRIIENPETTARRRELAEEILRGVRTARALWESGTRPDAMMGRSSRRSPRWTSSPSTRWPRRGTCSKAFSSRRARRRSVAPPPAVDLDRLRALLAEWRERIRSEMPMARQMLRVLFPERITFKPNAQQNEVELRAICAVGSVFERLLHPRTVVTPAGFEPAFTVRHALS